MRGITLARVVLLFSLATPAAAQTVLRSEVDAKRIGLNDQVQWTVTIEGPSLPDGLTLPQLFNLRIVGGPSVSTQMTFVNGRSSQSKSFLYVLQPRGVGRAEIGVLRVPTPSGDAIAQAIPLEVVGGTVVTPAPPRRSLDPFEQFFGRGRTRRAEPKLFVEARPSRVSLFVGEPLLLTYSIYTQADISGFDFAAAPQFTGFWSEDLPQPEAPRGEEATVEGDRYTRFRFYTKLLYPTRAGRLTIPSSTLKLGVSSRSFFGQGGVVTRATEAVTIEVKPIPEEPGFSGAVGRFRTSAAMDRTQVALGEAATLRFRVEGAGNLKWVERPPELVVPGAKVYPPEVKNDLRTGPGGISGARTWEYVLVPQTAGSLEIPALSFSYFDPAGARLVQTTTEAIPLQVVGALASSGPTGAAPPPALGARAGGLPLRTEIGSVRDRDPLSGRAVLALALGALLLHGVLWGGGRLASLRRSPPAAGAPRSARGALRDLRRIGGEGRSKESAAIAIEKTLFGVFGSLDGDDSERARAVRGVLAEVHAVRYAPQLGDYTDRLRELSRRAAEVVRRWA